MNTPMQVGLATRQTLTNEQILQPGESFGFMFHDVRDVHPGWFPGRYREGWSITPSDLRKELQAIKKIYGDRLNHERGAGAPVFITFDDGFKDHLNYAAPICEELGIKAYFFVSSEYVDGDHLCTAHLIQFGLAAVGSDACAKWLADKIGMPLVDALGLYGKSRLKDNTWLPSKIFATKYMRRNPDLARDFYEWASPVDEEEVAADLYMTSDDLAQLSGAMYVGGHGHTHHPLGDLSADAMKREVELSMAPSYVNCSAMSFPHGSYDESLLGILSAAQIDLAFTVRETHCTQLSIPRICGATNRLS